MDLCYGKYITIVSVILMALSSGVLSDECTDVESRCDRSTYGCNYQSFYANIRTRKICRSCNICIQPGSPVDSNGCPQIPCPEMTTFDTKSCYKPEVYNSWVAYHGQKCPTCEAMYCELAFKQA